MRGVRAAALLVAACAGSALAAGYDDFSLGVNANNRGEDDAAITAFTAALADSDLAQTYIPATYFGRAEAYLRKDKCVEALGDIDAGLKLKPDDVEAHLLRARAEECLKNYDAAEADAGAAIGLRANHYTYEYLARLQWNHVRFSQAAANFAQAVALNKHDDPHERYIVLWYAMSADRAGIFDKNTVAGDVHALDTDDWPVPLLNLYLGKEAMDDVYHDAKSRDAQTAATQKCEADFYIGEWQIARQNLTAARPLLELAVTECPHYFIEYSAAQGEIKRQP